MFNRITVVLIFTAMVFTGCDTSGGDDLDPPALLALTGNAGAFGGGAGGNGSGTGGGGGNGDSGGTPSPVCRTFATSVNVDSPASSFTTTYNTALNQATIVTNLGSTTIATYASRAAFVGDPSLIPPKATLTSTESGGVTVNYSYDAQGRLTGIAIPGQPHTYSAWDASGRRTVGLVSFTNCTNRNIARTYDDANRTVTEVQSGGTGIGCGATRSFIQRFDTDGIFTQFEQTLPSASIQNYTTNSRATVCL